MGGAHDARAFVPVGDAGNARHSALPI
jgi:integrase